MAKDTFYFTHDYHARSDERIIKLRAKHHAEGYGIYWMLIEKIYEAGGRLAADFSMLAYDLREDEKIIKDVATGFDLFFVDKSGRLGSRSADRRLKDRAERSKKRAEAGRIGGMAKAEHKQDPGKCLASAKQMPSKCLARKERKEKEIKEKEGEHSRASISACDTDKDNSAPAPLSASPVSTTTPPAPAAGAGKPAIAPVCAEVAQLVDAYLAEARLPVPNEKARQVLLRQHGAQAQDLLTLSGGDLAKAKLCMKHCIQDYRDREKPFRNFTMKNIVEDFPVWEQGRIEHERKIQRR